MRRLHPILQSHLFILLLACTARHFRAHAIARAPAAAAPAPANLTALMAAKGCAAFAFLLSANADGEQAFAGNVDSGLTVFCPLDVAVTPFLPKFKNLTADGKISLLLYHAVPVYYSIPMLQTGNGVVTTLATDGAARDYNLTVQDNGDRVTLRTGVTVATVTGTLVDEEPLAVHSIDGMLEPVELFKPAKPPAPAPAPATDKKGADAPMAGKPASPTAPVGSEEKPAADQKAADQSTAARNRVVRRSMAMAVAVAVALVGVAMAA